MHTSLDLDSRIYAILTCLIAGCIFGFSRVFLLLKNEEKDMLEGKMGVGPISREDAEIIWHQMIEEGKSLEDILLENKVHSREIMLLNPLAKKLAFPFSKEDEFITHCLRQRKVFKVKKTLENSGIGRRLLDLLETEELICVPLSVDKEVMGILLADNWHSQGPIVDSNVVRVYGRFFGFDYDFTYIRQAGNYADDDIDACGYHALLAALRQQVGDWSGSAALYRQLVALQPQQAAWQLGLAIALEQLDQPIQAAERYRLAVRGQGLDGNARRFAAERAAALGDGR